MNNGVSVTFDMDFVGTALTLLVFGWISGRLLGVRRGFWRAFVAGLVGLTAGYALVYVQFGDLDNLDDPGDVARLGVGFVGYVLLVTMLASIVIEAILRPKQGRSRSRLRFPRPFRWIGSKLALVQRLWQIGMAARRNGLVGRKYASRAALASPEGARALRLTLEECGGMFVKFGQIAAGRDDLLPATVTAELGELRTSVKPLPPAVVHQVLRAELGDAYESTFEFFDDEPLAAASIGVTHRARLHDGHDVIVKIQRPKIDEIVDRDGRVLLWGARQLERGSDSARSLGIVDLCKELLRSVGEELDFRREAANNAAMRRAAADIGVAYPKVDQDLTTRRVLVMDEVEGRPVSDAGAVDASPVPRSELSDRLLKSFLDQVLQAGVYHADPHPGNILIDSAGVMWFIDYGAVGHLDPITIEALQQMAVGFTLRDPGVLARAVRRIAGSAGEDLDIPSLEFDMGQVLTQIEGGGFGPAAIAEVVHVLRRHEVKVPTALTILGRSAVTMEGTLRQISPGYSMAEEATRLVRAESPAGDARDLATRELLRALPSLRPLPQLTEDVALQLRNGRLGIQVERYAGRDRTQVEQWLDRVLWATMGMVGLIGSALLLVAASLVPPDDGAGVYLRVIGFVGLVASSAMQMRTIARVLQRDTHELG